MVADPQPTPAPPPPPHAVRAPCAGTVGELHSFAEAQVEDGHVLAVVVPPEAAAATV